MRAWWYRYNRMWSVLLGAVFFRARSTGARNLPRRGGVLIVANHQSYMDPVLVAMNLPRPVYYLARDTLFRLGAFSWLIRSLNAVAVKRDGPDLKAFREAVRILQAGQPLLMFPEGTRTATGDVGRLRPGVWNIARRAGVPILPVAVEGAFEAWPRRRAIPRPHAIRVMYGRPISAGAVARIDSAALTDLLRVRLQELLDRSRAVREAVGGW